MKRELHLEEETYDQMPQRGAASLDVNNDRNRTTYKITLAHIHIYIYTVYFYQDLQGAA